ALEDAGYDVDWEDCTDNGGNPGNCDHPSQNARAFSDRNLERYDGRVVDGTGERRRYKDARTWVTGMGHFGASYAENGGDNELVKQLVGGVRWVAGEGRHRDCEV
ncbi:MAG TPA: hypothetical protein VNO82_23230, partial [Solirubrobacteraceae bacterium]|nr:hypothetical protein [Solirubrobacteraceae bacterium]